MAGNKNYIRGSNFERSILKKIKESGIFDGVRSAGSKGAADVIVWKEIEILISNDEDFSDQHYQNDIDIYAIQCKHSIKSDANLKALFEEDRVKDLAGMPDKFTKVILIKQPRSRNILQFVYNGYEWKLNTVFKI